jgi:xylulokinase
MPADTWWDEFASATSELLGRNSDVRVTAVGVSGMGPCVVVTDAEGRPLRSAILYGVDMRAQAEIEELADELGQDAVRERCGSRITTQAVGPKLLWLARHEPEAFECARMLFMPSSWLAFQLTGAYVLDHHSASQSVPMYDRATATWYCPWADLVRGQIQLPELVWPADVVGTVSASAAATTGLQPGIPVVAGTVDAWSEAVSVGAVRPGDLMLMYGTTMFLVATLDRPRTAPALWGTQGVYPGTSCLAGGMAASGAITQWLRDLFGGPDFPTLLFEAAASGPGARGLLMLPYWAGERTPIADPLARGVLTGLRLDHTRGDLYRAALEATAYGVRHNIAALAAGGAPITRVVAVGGGATGDLWTQIVSDVTGIEQVIPTLTIGASFGAAYLAAALQGEADIDAWNPPRRIVRPDPELSDFYDDRYRAYLELYPATADISHRLATPHPVFTPPKSPSKEPT